MTYKQLEDEVIAEFDALTFSLELGEVQHYQLCQKEKHTGELCGCEVAALQEKQKSCLRTALRRAAEEGARSGVVGKDYLWGDIQNQSLRGINAFFGEEVIKPNE